MSEASFFDIQSRHLNEPPLEIKLKDLHKAYRQRKKEKIKVDLFSYGLRYNEDMKQTITRKGSFDSGHRVMNERFKCFNYHGHTYLYELTFSWKDAGSLGYAVDFKEIKRIACQWIDDILDHGFIANPKDDGIIELCKNLGTKLYLMKLTDAIGYCNPSAENIAKELFFAISVLMNRNDQTEFALDKIVLHETPNCFVECNGLTEAEHHQLMQSTICASLLDYKAAKGELEYDNRKL